MEVSPAGKRGMSLIFFNPNAARDFISVMDGGGSLPVAGNRGWRGNRACLEESWPT